MLERQSNRLVMIAEYEEDSGAPVNEAADQQSCIAVLLEEYLRPATGFMVQHMNAEIGRAEEENLVE